MSTNLNDFLNRPEFQRRMRQRIEEGWTFEKIERMSTKEILGRLERLGIKVTSEQFRAAALRHDSAERLADEWYARDTFQPRPPYDTDFVWMASIVLWKRLLPDRISFEQIDERMQDGYDLLEAHRAVDACNAWWQVWEWLKEKVTPERSNLEALDQGFRGTQSVFNWCQDLEMELHNAGLDDAKYLHLHIRCCQEFLEIFGDVEGLMRGNFLRAEAKSYWHLDEIETAEAKFMALIDEYPDWAWGYIGWSDLYWVSGESPTDYAQGERILRQALKRPNLEDRQDVIDRLKRLRKERSRAKRSARRR